MLTGGVYNTTGVTTLGLVGYVDDYRNSPTLEFVFEVPAAQRQKFPWHGQTT